MSRLIDVDAFIREIRKIYCEDCARRKGIKNGKMRFCYKIGGVPCRACDIEDVLDALDDYAPTVHPEPHWIPVTERLPEKDGEYLTTWIDAQKKLCVNVFLVENGVWYWNQKYIFPNWRIIAWMPLPAPFKGVNT